MRGRALAVGRARRPAARRLHARRRVDDAGRRRGPGLPVRRRQHDDLGRGRPLRPARAVRHRLRGHRAGRRRLARRRRRAQHLVRQLPAVPRRGARPRRPVHRLRRRRRAGARHQPARTTPAPRRPSSASSRCRTRASRTPTAAAIAALQGTVPVNAVPTTIVLDRVREGRRAHPRPGRPVDAALDGRRAAGRAGTRAHDALADAGDAFGQTVISGSLLLAIPVALIAGLVSFASPCVLPLVPAYVGYLGGMTGSAPDASFSRGRHARPHGPGALAACCSASRCSSPGSPPCSSRWPCSRARSAACWSSTRT